jgi:hypothetical protein
MKRKRIAFLAVALALLLASFGGKFWGNSNGGGGHGGPVSSQSQQQ